MVFSANPVFVGQDLNGRRICLLSNMKFSSREREVAAYEKWFALRGYTIVRLSNLDWHFEGHGDALWHPGKRLIWGGYGYRSVPQVYTEISKVFSSPVILLELCREHFYHLDTCLCPLSETEALYFPEAFKPEGQALIRSLFPKVIAASEKEALSGLACNALVLGKKVIIQEGNSETNDALRALGYEVFEVDTSEFIKSGGSVFCMKLLTY